MHYKFFFWVIFFVLLTYKSKLFFSLFFFLFPKGEQTWQSRTILDRDRLNDVVCRHGIFSLIATKFDQTILKHIASIRINRNAETRSLTSFQNSKRWQKRGWGQIKNAKLAIRQKAKNTGAPLLFASSLFLFLYPNLESRKLEIRLALVIIRANL